MRLEALVHVLLASWIAAPAGVASTVITAALLGLAARRVLGARLGVVRLLATGGFALIVFPKIMSALVKLPPHPDQTTLAREGWFALLAATSTLMASMVFIVVVEALAPLGSIPAATAWGPGLRGRWRRTRRLCQISGVAIWHGVLPYLLSRSSAESGRQTPKARLGRALRQCFNAGGVTFVKVGQVLSTRSDSLPPEITSELAHLREAAEAAPWSEIERVMRDELGENLDTYFVTIDPDPLATASIGQVHAGRLSCGTDVVIKVQRPGIRVAVERDLDIVVRIGSRMERATRWGRALGTRALADGLAASIRGELDYRKEAYNLADLARKSSPGVRVPTPHLPLTTRRVLVMDRFRGVAISHAEPELERLNLDGHQVAEKVLDVLLRQILFGGVFHGDPHGGNIYLLEDGQIGLLDLGCVGRLDTELRHALQRLLLGFHHDDRSAVTDALLDTLVRPDCLDNQRLDRDVGRLLAQYRTGSRMGATPMLADLVAVAVDHGLEVPEEMAAVFRSLGTAEGALRELVPDFDLISASKKLTASHLRDQLTPQALGRSMTKDLITLLPVLSRPPRRLGRIASSAERETSCSSLQRVHDADRVRTNKAVHPTLLTALAGIVGLMAVLLLAAGGGPPIRDGIGLHALIGYHLLVISGILGLRVLVQIFRGSL